MSTSTTPASKTYGDYFQEYNSALAKIRSLLASPSTSEESHSECVARLQLAQSCLAAMQGLSEIENDTVKVQATKQYFARDITPLANEIRRMKDKIIIHRQHQKLNKVEQLHPLLHQLPPSSNYLFQGKKNTQQNGMYNPPVIRGATSTTNDEYDNANNYNGEEMQSLLLAQSSRDMLLESQSLCVESEEIGQNVLGSMYSQRQQLEMSSARLQDTISAMAQARQLLKQIGRKSLRNKIFLYMVIVLLLFANGYILYRFFIGKNSHRI